MEIGEDERQQQQMATEDENTRTRRTPWVGLSEIKNWSFWRAGIVEFLSSFLYLYITLLTLVAVKTRDKFDDVVCSPECLYAIAWASGATVFALVFCFSAVSGTKSTTITETETETLFENSKFGINRVRVFFTGGHFNPMVTFGFFLIRKISVIRGLYYMIMQCLGAICGAAVVKAFNKSRFELVDGGANLTSYESEGIGLFFELFGTFVLLYAVFSAIDEKRTAIDSHVPVSISI